MDETKTAAGEGATQGGETAPAAKPRAATKSPKIEKVPAVDTARPPAAPAAPRSPIPEHRYGEIARALGGTIRRLQRRGGKAVAVERRLTGDDILAVAETADGLAVVTADGRRRILPR